MLHQESLAEADYCVRASDIQSSQCTRVWICACLICLSLSEFDCLPSYLRNTITSPEIIFGMLDPCG